MLTVNDEEILVVARRGEGAVPPVDRVVAGASTSAAALSGRERVATMLAIVPVVALLSIGSA